MENIEQFKSINQKFQVLPRSLSLYIMSFLDPRSLSRASLVSWHWKFLSEQVLLHLFHKYEQKGKISQKRQDCFLKMPSP